MLIRFKISGRWFFQIRQFNENTLSRFFFSASRVDRNCQRQLSNTQSTGIFAKFFYYAGNNVKLRSLRGIPSISSRSSTKNSQAVIDQIPAVKLVWNVVADCPKNQCYSPVEKQKHGKRNTPLVVFSNFSQQNLLLERLEESNILLVSFQISTLSIIGIVIFYSFLSLILIPFSFSKYSNKKLIFTLISYLGQSLCFYLRKLYKDFIFHGEVLEAARHTLFFHLFI